VDTKPDEVECQAEKISIGHFEFRTAARSSYIARPSLYKRLQSYITVTFSDGLSMPNRLQPHSVLSRAQDLNSSLGVKPREDGKGDDVFSGI